MIPAGLTCAACHQPFVRQLARRTRHGWVHTFRCTSSAVLTGGRWVTGARGIAHYVTTEEST